MGSMLRPDEAKSQATVVPYQVLYVQLVQYQVWYCTVYSDDFGSTVFVSTMTTTTTTWA
jgi:hypothetical protein